MHPLEKKTLKIVQQENLLQPGEKVIIGVSAGPDSMALLHVLGRLAPVLDITPAAVYVNHGLRPVEAAKEKTLVAAAAKNLDLAFFTGAVDVKGFAEKNKLSIEHAARLLRYDFLEKTAAKFGASKIGLGHTADDQAEEILLRLIRGTARKGLSGMKTFRAGRYIRPFLHFPKNHLIEYLEKYSLSFLLDSSNWQDLYLRNRIRNDLLPYLTERYNPGIRQTLIRTAAILQDEEELLEKITEDAFAETVTVMPESFPPEYEGFRPVNGLWPQSLQINLELFAMQPRAIQRRLLEKCCWLMACEPRSRQIEQLLQLGLSDSAAGSLHLADGLRVTKNQDMLSLAYPRGRGPLRGNLTPEGGDAIPQSIIPGPGTYEFPALNKKLVVENIEGSLPKQGEVFPAGEYLDSDLFSFPITLRGPEIEDRFQPLGAPGSKKVFDFLSDQKVDQHKRRHVPVLCSDDSILALPGLRIDQRYKITDQTSEVIRVCWEEMEREVKE